MRRGCSQRMVRFLGRVAVEPRQPPSRLRAPRGAFGAAGAEDFERSTASWTQHRPVLDPGEIVRSSAMKSRRASATSTTDCSTSIELVTRTGISGASFLASRWDTMLSAAGARALVRGFRVEVDSVGVESRALPVNLARLGHGVRQRAAACTLLPSLLSAGGTGGSQKWRAYSFR